MEVPAPFNGTLKEIKVAEGDKVSTGSLIMVFETLGSAPAAPTAATAVAEPFVSDSPKAAEPAKAAVEQKSASAEEFKENHEYAHASPVVRRIAREFGVTSQSKGTGRKSRILKEDVQLCKRSA